MSTPKTRRGTACRAHLSGCLITKDYSLHLSLVKTHLWAFIFGAEFRIFAAARMAQSGGLKKAASPSAGNSPIR